MQKWKTLFIAMDVILLNYLLHWSGNYVLHQVNPGAEFSLAATAVIFLLFTLAVKTAKYI